MVWGVFPAGGPTLPGESAPGVPGLALALSWSDLALLHLPGAWQRTSNQSHVLDLTSLTSLWRNEEWMIKASQEKQVFMCTSTKKSPLPSPKCILRGEKKNQWQKLPQIGTQFVEHRQNKNQTKNQETSPQKHCLYSYFIWKLLLFIRG